MNICVFNGPGYSNREYKGPANKPASTVNSAHGPMTVADHVLVVRRPRAPTPVENQRIRNFGPHTSTDLITR